MTHILVFNLALALVCGYALLTGGAPERLTALLFIVAGAATYLLPFYHRESYHSVELMALLIDVAMLAGLVGIAAVADRFWPLYISALHLIAIAIHGVKAYQPDLVPWMYAAANAKIAYPMLVLLAIGAMRHRERLVRDGRDPDWSFQP